MSLPDLDDPRWCPATTTSGSTGFPYFCTRDRDHEPPHQACGLSDQVYAEWTDEWCWEGPR